MEKNSKKLCEDGCTKEVELTAEEIEGYGTCSGRTQMCLTDCPWPFDGAYMTGAN